jgi:hypothetical protein
VVEKRREHSRKPDCVRDRIERLVLGPYLELFARETKPGWDCWGNQVALFDRGAVITRRQPSRLVDSPTLPLRLSQSPKKFRCKSTARTKFAKRFRFPPRVTFSQTGPGTWQLME